MGVKQKIYSPFEWERDTTTTELVKRFHVHCGNIVINGIFPLDQNQNWQNTIRMRPNVSVSVSGKNRRTNNSCYRRQCVCKEIRSRQIFLSRKKEIHFICVFVGCLRIRRGIDDDICVTCFTTICTYNRIAATSSAWSIG